MLLDPKLVEINEKLRIIGKQKLALKGRQRRLERITKTGGNFFTDAFSKVKNEFVNPDSKLRQTVVKPVEEVVNKTKNEFENPDSKLRKEIVPRFDITKTDLSNYPNSAKKTMATLGDLPVESAEIVRTPISAVLSKFINLLSAGKFEQASKDAGYDKLFHLQLVLNVRSTNGQMKKVAIQKTERVQVDGSLTGVTAETEYLNISIGNKKFTSNEMLEKTRKRIGDRDFFGYDSFKNNCQNFILNLLKSEGLAGAKETKFLYQDTKAIADKIPALSKKIMNFTTDAGNVFSKVLGFGNGDLSDEQINKYKLNAKKELDEWIHDKQQKMKKEGVPTNDILRQYNSSDLEEVDDLIHKIENKLELPFKKGFDVKVKDLVLKQARSDVEKVKLIIRLLLSNNKQKQTTDLTAKIRELGDELGVNLNASSSGIMANLIKIPEYNVEVVDFEHFKPSEHQKPIVIALGKPKRGRPKKDVVSMPKKEYIKEHKRLIKVLEDAGKEGERQKQEVEHRRIGGMVLKLMEMDRQHKMGGSKANEKIIKRHAKMIADEIDTYNKKFGGNWFTDTFNKVKDAVVSTANKVGNEFTNPDSVLRQKVVKPIEDVAKKVGNEFTNPSSIFRSQVLAPVERSFEKFGRDTKEAFEDIGNKIKNEFTNSDSELARAFKPLTDTIGNEDWWKKTMTTPDTYILLITIALDVANMAGVPGAGLASQATKMIGDLAQGRKVSVADLANLALAMIPTPKVPGSQGIFNQIKSQVIGNSGMSAVARSQLIGRNIVKVGKELVGDQKVGFGEMTENGKNYKLHAIVINKKNFDKNDAVLEAVKYGSKKGMFMRETKQSFRFRNIPKTKFIPKSYRTKKIGKTGVSLIYGELK